MERSEQITRLSKAEFFREIFEIEKKQVRVTPQIPLSKLSKRVAERLITEGAPIPDCVSCGACCSYGLISIERRDPEPLEQYVEITPQEAPDVVIERFLKRDAEDGRCGHLTGSLGVEVGCTVYEDRPRMCRDFEAGSDRCFAYRRFFGIDPPLGENELAAALDKLERSAPPLKVWAVDIAVESKVFTFDPEAGEMAEPLSEEVTLRVMADLNNGESRKIHSYDAAKEHWYEHELEGMTLADALELVEKRRVD